MSNLQSTSFELGLWMLSLSMEFIETELSYDSIDYYGRVKYQEFIICGTIQPEIETAYLIID